MPTPPLPLLVSSHPPVSSPPLVFGRYAVHPGPRRHPPHSLYLRSRFPPTGEGLWRQPWILVCPPSSPLSRVRELTSRRLLVEPWMLPDGAYWVLDLSLDVAN